MKRRGYHHGNLREALIAATLRAIAHSGPDGFTLRDVARRAGVSPAAPYRHFADKDELLAAVAVECLGRITEAMREARAAASPNPLAQFRATGIAIVQFATAHPEHFRAMTSPGLFARLPAEQRAGFDAAGTEQRAALAAAQAAGVIARIDLDEILLAANALVHGLAHMIVEGQLGPVDAARATELAIAATSVLGVGLIPRADGIPSDHLRTDGSRNRQTQVGKSTSDRQAPVSESTSGRRRRPRSATR